MKLSRDDPYFQLMRFLHAAIAMNFMKVFWRTIVLAAMLVSSSLNAGEESVLLSSVLAVTQHQEEQSLPIRYQFHCQQRFSPGAWSKASHVFLFDGLRRRIEMRNLDHETAESELFSYDGNKHFNRQRSKDSFVGGVATEKDMISSYHNLVYLTTDSYASFLKANASKLSARPMKFRNQDCVLVSGKLSEAGLDNVVEIKLVLSPRLAYQPLSIEKVYDWQSAGLGAASEAAPLKSIHTVEIAAHTEVDGAFFPAKVTTRYQSLRKDNSLKEVGEIQLSVDAVERRVATTDNMFTLEFPEGSTVFDRDSGIVYKEGVPGSSKKIGELKSAVKKPSPFPVWEVVTALLAICTIAIGIWYWRSHRSPS